MSKQKSIVISLLILSLVQIYQMLEKGRAWGKEGGTSSGLLWEVERILGEVESLPQILLMENVPAITNKNFCKDFEKWKRFLESKGYSNYTGILNSKDYGIPQSRKRCFMISKLNYELYTFPKPMPLQLKLKDMLEAEVSSKYYLSEKRQKTVMATLQQGHKAQIFTEDSGLIGTLTASCGNGGNYNPYINNKGISKTIRAGGHGSTDRHTWDIIRMNDLGISLPYRAYSEEGLSPTLTAAYPERIVFQEPIIAAIRGRNIDKSDIQENRARWQQILEINDSGCSNTLTTVQKDNVVITPNKRSGECKKENVRLRRLTPLECWRLMGFDDEDYIEARKALNEAFYKGKDKADSQLYKQAGNSIVVNVLEAIFKQLLW